MTDEDRQSTGSADAAPAAPAARPARARGRNGRPPTRLASGLLSSVLEGLSEGVVLVDGEGNLRWCNPAAADGLGLTAVARGKASCCALLGCAPHACQTRRALTGQDGAAARRAAVGAPGHRRPAWVSVRSLAGATPPLVAFELRFAATASGDDPDAPPADGPQLRIGALGPLTVEVGAQQRGGDWLAQRPGQALRYLIAHRGRPASSEAIADALWPDRGPAAMANVRYSIYKLREHLEGPERSGASLIVRRPGGYHLDPARVRLDVDGFVAGVAAGLEAQAQGDAGRAERELRAALSLYRGDFLAEEPYGDWAVDERDRLRGRAGDALRALSELALGADRLDHAAAHLERLARMEPFDSDVHRRLVEVCLRRGRRTEAVRHYAALRLRLQRAFGELPDFALHDAAAAVARAAPAPARNGRPSASATPAGAGRIA